MKPLTPIQSRLLAVFLLVAGVAALAVAIAIPLQRMHKEYDTTIEERRDRIARYDRIAAGRDEMEKAIAAVKARDAGKFYLKSSAPALAAADIQQIVQALVEVNGLRQESTGIAPHKDEGERRKITVILRLRGKLQGLQHFLYSIESTQPYLFVDNVNIQSTVRQTYIPQPGVEPEVTAALEVSGYAMKRKPDAAPRH